MLALLAAAQNGNNEEAVKLHGDKYLNVDTVELPAAGVDPRNMTVVLKLTVHGCRMLEPPIVVRRGQTIHVVPQSYSMPTPGGRAPCAVRPTRAEQVAKLGNLPRGTYRLRVATAQSQVWKILDIY